MKRSVDVEDKNLGMISVPWQFSFRLGSKNPQTESQLYLDKVDSTLLVIIVCTVACIRPPKKIAEVSNRSWQGERVVASAHNTRMLFALGLSG
jgi:hypothetical protein